MPLPARRVLLEQLQFIHEELSERFQGLTDAELYWEPVPGCWSVRPREACTAPIAIGKGAWTLDWAEPDPDPPPFTTIAWRLTHLSMVTAVYREYVFGPGEMWFNDFIIPRRAAEMVPWWHAALRGFREGLEGIGDRDVEKVVTTSWVSRSIAQWAQALAFESTHHGAEISCLRDLFRARGGGGSLPPR